MRRVRDIPAPIIALRIDVATSLGANPEEILRESNILPEDISNPKARITIEQALAVWKSIIQQTGRQDIGLECGLEANFKTMGILGYVMINSSSITHAWMKFCNYQELVLSLISQKISFAGEFVRFDGIMQEEWQDDFRYTIDYIYSSCLTLIKNCTPLNIHPIEVGFNFPEPENSSRYNEIYAPAVIRFSCKNPYIVYKKTDLENPITSIDFSIYQHFDLMLQEIAYDLDQINNTSRGVKKIIVKKLKASVPKINEVAIEMAMSVSAIQQRLKKEETSFQIILNTVRRDIAIKQLSQSKNNITDVAFLTGFSSISAFSRSFKKWTGKTLTDFQN